MHAGADEIQSVAGTREYITCSGRGYCVDGEYCSCLDEFSSSSGAVGETGGRADCGFYSGATPTDDNCPHSPSGDVCFGHGVCVGYAKICVCDPGCVGSTVVCVCVWLLLVQLCVCVLRHFALVAAACFQFEWRLPD